MRIFNPVGSWPVGPLTFSHYGPRHRFDHHDPSPSRSPQDDSVHSTYYAAWTLSCCVAECFGDTLRIDKPHLHIAYPALNRTLKLLDLSGNGAMRVGSVSALCAIAERDVTQAWSRYFYSESVFANCDGIRFHSAHNNELALVLYERAENALNCPASQVIALSYPNGLPGNKDFKS